jgi:hypothetical protein
MVGTWWAHFALTREHDANFHLQKDRGHAHVRRVMRRNSRRQSPKVAVVATAARATESESNPVAQGASLSYLTFKWNKGILHSYAQ